MQPPFAQNLEGAVWWHVLAKMKLFTLASCCDVSIGGDVVVVRNERSLASRFVAG